MMRKRGGSGNPTNNNRSNGNSSTAVSKLLMQNQSTNTNSTGSSSSSYRDGQSIILDVREPILAGNTTSTKNQNGRNTSSSNGGGGDDSNHQNNNSTAAQLNAKNHRLAKELSEVRIRHREECKNVTRLTMENMNLASRCREAITQAANMKKDLSIQKRKTAEAVAQTHLLLDQLKKMKQQQLLLQQLQKEDESKLLSQLPQSTSNTQSNDQPIVVDENTIAVPTNGTTVSSSGLENEVDVIKEIVLVDENVDHSSEIFQPTTSIISSAPNSSDIDDAIPSPITTKTSGIINDVHLTSANETNHDDIHADAVRRKGTTADLLDGEAISSSPSAGKLSLEVVSPRSIKSNVVDLDISYDFENERDESYVNDENHPIVVETMSDDERGNISTDPSAISPLDTAIEYDSDDVPNDDELKLFSSDVISIDNTSNNAIQPTNLDEYCFQNNSTKTTQQLPHNLVDPNEPSKSDDYDIDIDVSVQSDVTSKTPHQKRTVASILTTFVSDEEYYHDDSEHKCDDCGSDRYIIESLEITTPTIATTNSHNFTLVSSDDYEGASVMDDHDDNGADLSGDKEIADENLVVNVDDIRSTTETEALDDVDSKIPRPKDVSSSLLSTSSALLIDGSDSTDALICHTDFNAPINAIPKSKDLWLEDYDEAAIQGCDPDDDETSDTLSGLINTSSSNISDSMEKAVYFPHSASPKVSIKSNSTVMSESNLLGADSSSVPTTTKRYMLPNHSSLVNESYEDEFPSDIIEQRRYSSSSTRLNKTKPIYEAPSGINVPTEETNDVDLSPTTSSPPPPPPRKFFGPLQDRSQPSSLISSIDAFEASFQTNFPESFTPKDSPNTSPMSGAKLAISDASTNDPFPSNKSLLNSVNGFDDTKSNEEVSLVAKEVTPYSNEELKTWSNGIHERDASLLQRNNSLQSADNPIDVFVGEATLCQQSTAPTSLTSKLVASPTHQSKTLKNGISDQSARWLMEVKASTEKHKYSADTNSDTIASQVDSVHLQTPLDGDSKSGYGTNGATLAHSVNTKSSTVTTNIAKSQQSTRPAQISDPVFRQFPRTTTPAKSFKHISSLSSRINFVDETLSASISDKAPLLQGRVSDDYSTPQSTSPQQKITGESDTSVRSRNVSTLSQNSSSLSSERGRLSISRRKGANENSLEAPTPKGLSPLAPETKHTSDHGMTKGRNLTVNVRERAAIYSKVSSPTVGISPNNGKSLTNNVTDANPYYSRPSYRGTSRSTVQILEDEGEIPMQTSLSPRKFRNGDYSHRLTTEPTNRSGSDEKNTDSVANSVENVAKNYQRLTESANAKVVEHHDRRTTDIDVGKQRRHINLSGRGRLSRKIDHENDIAHINEN